MWIDKSEMAPCTPKCKCESFCGMLFYFNDPLEWCFRLFHSIPFSPTRELYITGRASKQASKRREGGIRERFAG